MGLRRVTRAVHDEIDAMLESSWQEEDTPRWAGDTPGEQLRSGIRNVRTRLADDREASS
jgi:hypothetical protein